MTYVIGKCKICGKILQNHSSNMPYDLYFHVRDKHPKEYKILESLENQEEKIQNKISKLKDKFWEIKY